jgi:methyltransferase (TIGR00027 family)
MDFNEQFKASRTALATALMRAIHTRLDRKPLIDDPWGDRIVPEFALRQIRDAALARLAPGARAAAHEAAESIVDASLRASPAYAGVILRTAYAEDALRAAAAGGVRQYVLIGAGFDSFALRRPEFARDLEIFEIDHKATQQLKLRRLAECGLELPRSVHFIAADLSTEALGAALSQSAFDASQRAFFSWLGVTMYLTRAANLATLRAVAGAAAAGSELVFTYLDERAFTATSNRFQELRRRVAAAGEPFQSGFDPATLARQLRDTGFELLEDLAERELLERLDPEHCNGLTAGGFSHIARARSLERLRAGAA